MPCRDWTVEDEWRMKGSVEKAMLSASLCAILTLLEKDPDGFALMLKKIKWKEAGVSKRELMRWWEDHKEKDVKRRERMAEQLKEIKIRKDALAKLTPEEKKILGIK